MPQNLVQPPTIQRAILNRHHQSRKSNSSIAPKAEPVTTPLNTSLPPHKSATSPKSRPTPSSHANSPTANVGSAFSPAPSDSISLRGSVGGLPRQAMPTSNANASARSMMQSGAGARSQSLGQGASFYPTPAFQSHIEQLGASDPNAPVNCQTQTNAYQNTSMTDRTTWSTTRSSIRQTVAVTMPAPSTATISRRCSSRRHRPRPGTTSRSLTMPSQPPTSHSRP